MVNNILKLTVKSEVLSVALRILVCCLTFPLLHGMLPLIQLFVQDLGRGLRKRKWLEWHIGGMRAMPTFHFKCCN